MHNCSPGEAPFIKGNKFSMSQSPTNEIEKELMKHIDMHLLLGASVTHRFGPDQISPMQLVYL